MKKVKPKLKVSLEQEILLENWEKYRGSIVMVVGDKIFSTKRATNIDKMVRNIEGKFHRRPLITYIPKEGTLILSYKTEYPDFSRGECFPAEGGLREAKYEKIPRL